MLFAPSEDLELDSPVLTPGVDLSTALTQTCDPQTIPSMEDGLRRHAVRESRGEVSVGERHAPKTGQLAGEERVDESKSARTNSSSQVIHVEALTTGGEARSRRQPPARTRARG